MMMRQKTRICIAMACLTGMTFTASAQSLLGGGNTFNNGVNGTVSPGNSGNENTTANPNGVGNSTANTSGTPAPGNVPCQSAILTAGCTGGPVGAVPEPETYALLLTGLGLVAIAVRRRKKDGTTKE
jgi:hypothetical protein